MNSRLTLLAPACLDATIAFCSVVLSFVARFDPSPAFEGYGNRIAAVGAIAAILKPATFFGLGLYSVYWRYVDARVAVKLVAATISASAALAVLVALVQSPIPWLRGIPASVFLIDFLATTLAVAAVRVWLHHRLASADFPTTRE